MTKLISVRRANDGKHKYVADFLMEGGRRRRSYFGAVGMDDYTITHDRDQRDRYRERHRGDLKTNDPTRPGYLAMHLLWGDSTSLRRNIAAYRNRFDL